MAWEWVAPVAGSAVGIAGLITSYLLARDSRNAQASLAETAREASRADKLRDERREAYVNFLALLEQAESSWRDVDFYAKQRADKRVSPDGREKAAQQLTESIAAGKAHAQALRSATLLVLLVAPHDVRAKTAAVMQDHHAAMTGNQSEDEAQAAKTAFSALRAAMREDLGIPKPVPPTTPPK